MKTKEIDEIAIKPEFGAAYKVTITRSPLHKIGPFENHSYSISYYSYSRLLKTLAQIKYYGILTD